VRIINNVIKIPNVHTRTHNEVAALRLIKLIQLANKHLINITHTQRVPVHNVHLLSLIAKS